MKKLTRYFLLLFFLLVALVLPARVWAVADFYIDCTDSACTQTPSGTILSESNAYPGWSETKTINLKNSSSTSKEMAIKATQASPVSILENVIQISILRGATVIWGGSLADFYAQSKISMGIFSPGANADFYFTASMDLLAGNEYQNRETIFDLTLGFWEEPAPTPTPTTATDGGTTEGVGGVSAPVCGDAKPGVPTGLIATAGPGTGQITLSWTPPGPPYTYFLIAYSDNSSSPKWGNPDVGNGTSYTVSGLGSGTYWFWLRAGNGCMPGDFVGPVTPGAIAGIPGAGPVAPGFAPGVLGEKTPGEVGEAGATEAGKVAGAEARPVCWWWLILSLLEAGLIAIYYWFLDKKKRRFWWAMPLGLAILTYIGDHYIAHRYLTPSRFCSWMALWVALAAVIPSAIYLLPKRKRE